MKECIDGNKIDDNVDKEFINVAYKLLMQDEIKDISDINLTTFNYDNYLIAKKLENKVLKKKK